MTNPTIFRVFTPFPWIVLWCDVAGNCLQAAEMMMTRRMG